MHTPLSSMQTARTSASTKRRWLAAALALVVFQAMCVLLFV